MSSELLPDENYPFDNISIKTPKALQGGTYSAQLELDSKSLIIQTPKCKTKKGIHKTSKQIYCDLLLNKETLQTNERRSFGYIERQDCHNNDGSHTINATTSNNLWSFLCR